MKTLSILFLSSCLLFIASAAINSPVATAQSCLGPSQQRKAIASGQVRPFGVIASRLRGELVNARLCRSGNGLVYVVTVLEGSLRVDAVFNAANGKRLR